MSAVSASGGTMGRLPDGTSAGTGAGASAMAVDAAFAAAAFSGVGVAFAAVFTTVFAAGCGVDSALFTRLWCAAGTLGAGAAAGVVAVECGDGGDSGSAECAVAGARGTAVCGTPPPGSRRTKRPGSAVG